MKVFVLNVYSSILYRLKTTDKKRATPSFAIAGIPCVVCYAEKTQAPIRRMEYKSSKYSKEQTRQKIQAWCDKAERCHRDVREKLKSWNTPYREGEELIVWLIEQDLLNEERYAKAFAHDKFVLHRWGELKIKQHLQSKGISQRNIADALLEIQPAQSIENMLLLIKKKEPQLKGLQLYQKKYKLKQYLYSKGYEPTAIEQAITHYMD